MKSVIRQMLAMEKRERKYAFYHVLKLAHAYNSQTQMCLNLHVLILMPPTPDNELMESRCQIQ